MKLLSATGNTQIMMVAEEELQHLEQYRFPAMSENVLPELPFYYRI